MNKPVFVAEITLTKEEVEQALKNYIVSHMGGVEAESVRLNLDTDGGDTPGVPRPIFKNAVVTVKPKSETQQQMKR